VFWIIASFLHNLETAMLILGRKHFAEHRRWAWFVVLFSLIFTGWFLVDANRQGRWPSGGSMVGLTAGTIAGLIMFFEMFLWPRKTLFRAWRIGRTKHWLKAHHWLGILCLPLALLHGGFHFSMSQSQIAAMLMWLTTIVVLSGVLGAWIQNIMPKRMLETLPGETIVGQIPQVLESYRQEAETMVREVTGQNLQGGMDLGGSTEFLLTSSTLSSGSISGQSLQIKTTLAHVQGTETLYQFWEKQFDLFMQPGHMASTGLGNEKTAESIFQTLMDKVPVDAHPVVNQLAFLCRQRRQFDKQQKMHFWLHSWLVGHVALSVALMVLLVVHIVLALQYP
jgi:hypothetical protein